MPELERALQELLGDNERLRMAAHDTLMRLAEDPAQGETVALRLAPFLESERPDARGTAYLVLATATGKHALPRLEPKLSEPDAAARSDLTHALGLAGEGARPLLIRLLRDQVFEVRMEAALALVEWRDAAGIDVLIQALDVAAARFQALSALQKLGDRRAMEKVGALFRKFFVSGYDRVGAAGVLARLGDEDAREWLVRRVGRRGGDERGLAIELVGELRMLGAAEALVDALKDRKNPFRGAAARSLGMMGDERRRELLAGVLLDEAEDPDTRMDAAEGLMHLGTHQARQALADAADNVGHEGVREVVREALVELERGEKHE